MDLERIKLNMIIKDLEDDTIEKDKAIDKLKMLHSCNCSRCGNKLSDRWENKANKFVLGLHFAGGSYSDLWGEGRNFNKNINYDLHPALLKSNGQHVIIECGIEKDYKLCETCYRDFASLVGDFLMSGV